MKVDERTPGTFISSCCLPLVKAVVSSAEELITLNAHTSFNFVLTASLEDRRFRFRSCGPLSSIVTRHLPEEADKNGTALGKVQTRLLAYSKGLRTGMVSGCSCSKSGAIGVKSWKDRVRYGCGQWWFWL